VNQFINDTRIEKASDGSYSGRFSGVWSIGMNPNGGYAMTPLMRAMADASGQPDPLSVTAHFLRPCVGDADLEIQTAVRGSLTQEGKVRLTMLGTFSDLTRSQGVDEHFAPMPPDLPPVEQCVHRSKLAQGVEIPLLKVTDIYLRPQDATPSPDKEALIEGWVRLADGTNPDVFSLPYFVDAFPPSPIARVENVGWVPTLEFTVQVRARPAPGWLRGRFHCDDLQGGRMVESGILWDATGTVVARSRQLALVLEN
jgi:acyl-CoA thioesterase